VFSIALLCYFFFTIDYKSIHETARREISPWNVTSLIMGYIGLASLLFPSALLFTVTLLSKSKKWIRIISMGAFFVAFVIFILVFTRINKAYTTGENLKVAEFNIAFEYVENIIIPKIEEYKKNNAKYPSSLDEIDANFKYSLYDKEYNISYKLLEDSSYVLTIPAGWDYFSYYSKRGEWVRED